MLKQFSWPSDDCRGFTLIELMIVIAVIGLLAAIAIPNYIAYRNKAYCNHAESDASIIANEVAAYFAVPSNTTLDKNRLSTASLTNKTWDVTSADPNLCITITVQDDSGRCPGSYQQSMPGWQYNVFTKAIRR